MVSSGAGLLLVSGVIALGRPVGRPVAVVGARPVAATELCVGWTMIVEGSHEAVLTGAVVVALVGRLTGFEVWV